MGASGGTVLFSNFQDISWMELKSEPGEKDARKLAGKAGNSTKIQ